MDESMTDETIDHATLTKLAETGVLRSAHAVGRNGGWGIVVKNGTTEYALAAQPSHQVRIFRTLESLVDYLKCVGIARFDADNYDRHCTTATKRPDRAAAMNNAQAAAAYSKWLKAEVQEAIDDTSPTVPHEEAMRQVRAAIGLA
jgi:hypothetical protein